MRGYAPTPVTDITKNRWTYDPLPGGEETGEGEPPFCANGAQLTSHESFGKSKKGRHNPVGVDGVMDGATQGSLAGSATLGWRA